MKPKKSKWSHPHIWHLKIHNIFPFRTSLPCRQSIWIFWVLLQKKHYLLPTFEDIENGLVGPWEPPAESEPAEEVETTVEATSDRQAGSTPSLEDAFEDCTEISTPPESIWGNANCGSLEFLPKLEQQPFQLNPSSNPEEQPFGLNPNFQQVFINHVSLPQGRQYENSPYSGFQPFQSFPQFYPPQPPPPYGYNNPPPYQYYQDPCDNPNYMPPHNYYVNSPWGSIPFSPPFPLIPPNHIRPSVNMVKQNSTNLREIPCVMDQMKNLSISCKPQGTISKNAFQKNNIDKSPRNINTQSFPAEKFIAHDFQQHSNLVEIKTEDWIGQEEKSEVTSYSVDDTSSEEASYEEVSGSEHSSPASVLMYTLELIDIAGNLKKKL